MLDISYIRENPDKVRESAKQKKTEVDIDAILKLDEERRTLIARTEDLRRERNEVSKAKDIERGKQLKKEIAEEEAKLAEVTTRFDELMRRVPNVPSTDTPVGPDESGNKVVRKWGEPPKFDFEPRDHVEIGKMLDIIDQDTSAKVAGARFAYLKRDLVLLQQAIVTHVMTTLTNRETLARIIDEAGLDLAPNPFVPINPPLFIRAEVMEKMARLEPRDERYYVQSDDLFLIGSAEHTLGPMHMDQTLRENDMPLRYFACTPAFRREAGSYGKDTRGILRVHQFDKIEMESFCLPETSVKEQDLFVAVQEHLMRDLGIPYQVVQVCTGDMGGPDHRQIDIESWMPGQGKYRETHTSDLMTDYQARRLNTRVKRNAGGTEYVHMNDGTAIALGRTLIAIIENNQRADGSFDVPEMLMPYMGGKAVIGA